MEVASLESRILMCADGDELLGARLPSNLGTYPAIHELATVKASTATTSSTTVAASSPLSSVPVLNSRPGATANLYLDFNGDTTSTWGSYTPGTTPAYDTDGDPTTFSDAELTSIRQIFDRVAEKYSPFNINVTTVDPGNLTNKVTAKAVIGGAGAWLGSQVGGVAYVGGFSNSASNVAFIFSQNLGNGYAQYVGEAISHESGHLFGLQHQSAYDASGNKASEYAPANPAGDAPVMGNSYTARRGMWWYGTSSVSSTSVQDDLKTISSTTTNGFGYRNDDFGNTTATASALTLSGTSVSGAGVIEKTTDTDVFSFVSGAGSVNLSVNPSTAGGMLDAKIDLRDANGTVITTADTGLAESITATVTGGTYYLTVGSHAGYGDVGQYTVSGTVQSVTTPTPTAPVAPSGLTATVLTTTSVRLKWTDNSTDETGFKIYASRDGSKWTLLGTVGANVTTVDNTGLRRNATYYYKVTAYNAVGDSADSNVVNTKTALSPTTALAGDVNFDGVVDFLDLAALSHNYNTSVATTSGGDATVAWQQGDLNDDGVVDFSDLAMLSQNYNTGTPLTSDLPDDGASFGTLSVVSSGAAAGAVVAPSSGSTAMATTSSTSTIVAAKPKVNHKAPAFSLKPIVRRPRIAALKL